MTTVRGATGRSHDVFLSARRGDPALCRCGAEIIVTLVLPGDQPTCVTCARLLGRRPR